MTEPSSMVPPPPGTVVNHLDARRRQYVGSPSLAILAEGTYLASHDVFGPGSPRNETHVFASADRGATWEPRAHIVGQWWSTLFTHRGALYLMGTSREYGRVVIRRSDDDGAIWTTPSDATTGLLLDQGEYHCAPVPVLSHNGRLWRGMEQVRGQGSWSDRHFCAFMMSAPVDADLLVADSWTSSNRLARNPAVLGDPYGVWLEGNAVVTPDGEVVDVLRMNHWTGATTKAAIVRIDPSGRRATFYLHRDLVDLPGAVTKFTIRHDQESDHYWTLANHVPDPKAVARGLRARNTLALLRSPDLRNWEVRATVLHHSDDLRHGFQYVDWLTESEDIVFLARTAWDDNSTGAHNYHDANFLTFHRITDFRHRTDHKEIA